MATYQSTDNAAWGNAGPGANASGSAATVVDAGSNRCMVVLVQGEGAFSSPPTVTALTYGGVALTQVGRIANADWGWTEVWRLVNPAVGSASLAITLSGADSFSVKALVAQGVDQTTPLATLVTANGTASSASLTVAGVTTGDLCFSSLSLDGVGHNPTPGTNETELYERDVVGGDCETAAYTQAGADGGAFTPAWTTSCKYAFAASAFKNAGGGGTAPSNSVAPAISGTTETGQTLTCSTGTWSGDPTITYAYQWKRNGTNISAATSSTYLLDVADEGQSIKCTVTATNGVGSVSADSNTVTPTAPGVDPPAPTCYLKWGGALVPCVARIKFNGVLYPPV